jgi:hypothetical protein
MLINFKKQLMMTPEDVWMEFLYKIDNDSMKQRILGYKSNAYQKLGDEFVENMISVKRTELKK